MIYDIRAVAKWPKWEDCRCKDCGELVPAGYGHYCDRPAEKPKAPGGQNG
jgi:hypothetical protein